MWRRFKRHKVGMVGLVSFSIVLFCVVFAEFVAPYGANEISSFNNVPPQRLRFRDENGTWHWRPFVYGLDRKFDLSTGKMDWIVNTSRKHPVSLFVEGADYTICGIKSNIHLFGVEEGRIFICGTDSIGQDVFSRLLYGGRLSLAIAAATTVVSLGLGTVAGLVSGYFGGWPDMVIQRIVELFIIIPDVPLGLALAAFLPPDLSPVLLMSGIALVLAVVSWGNVARQIRGKTLALRHSDYIRAAICIGATTPRVLFRHILPSLYSHLIVLATLTLPQVILAESSLSFLGFGVRPPMSSWGSLLKDAQNFRVIALYPWEMLPGIAIMITVLSLNFVGDALRDAFDPYSTN
jgi:peptide/nickel transport system permease protein